MPTREELSNTLEGLDLQFGGKIVLDVNDVNLADPSFNSRIVIAEFKVPKESSSSPSLGACLLHFQRFFHLISGILAFDFNEEGWLFVIVTQKPKTLEDPSDIDVSGETAPVSKLCSTSTLIGVHKIEEIETKILVNPFGDWSYEGKDKFLQHLPLAMAEGQIEIEGQYWFANLHNLVSSTPHPPPKPLPVPLPEDYLAQMKAMTEALEQLKAKVASLEAEKVKPPEPNVSIINESVLAKSLAEHSEHLINKLAESKILGTAHVKMQSQFSGDKLKGDSSYETWEYEAKQLKDTHKPSVVRQALLKSLRGSALEALMSISSDLNSVDVDTILDQLRAKYGISSSFDSMMGTFFLQKQEEEESVSQFATRIESQLRDLSYRFPEKLKNEAVKLDTLRERFFHGVCSDIRGHIMFLYKSKSTFNQLLELAREVEASSERAKLASKVDNSQTKDSKPKVQVKSEVVTPNQDPALAKLISAAKLCEQEQTVSQESLQALKNAFTDYEQRNNYKHVPYAQRGGSNGRGQGRGRGGPNYGNPNPRYLGNNYDPNYQSNRGRGSFGRGGRGRSDQNPPYNPQVPPPQINPSGQNGQNQNQNSQSNNQAAQNQSNGNGSTTTPRGNSWYCKWCRDLNYPQYNHNPLYCPVVKQVMGNYMDSQRQAPNLGDNLNG